MTKIKDMTPEQRRGYWRITKALWRMRRTALPGPQRMTREELFSRPSNELTFGELDQIRRGIGDLSGGVL